MRVCLCLYVCVCVCVPWFVCELEFEKQKRNLNGNLTPEKSRSVNNGVKVTFEIESENLSIVFIA